MHLIHSFICSFSSSFSCNHFFNIWSEQSEQMKWHVWNMLFTRPILMEQNVMHFTQALTIMEEKRVAHAHVKCKCKWIVWTASVCFNGRAGSSTITRWAMGIWFYFFFFRSCCWHMQGKKRHGTQWMQQQKFCTKNNDQKSKWKKSWYSHCQTLKIKTNNYVIRELKQIGI